MHRAAPATEPATPAPAPGLLTRKLTRNNCSTNGRRRSSGERPHACSVWAPRLPASPEISGTQEHRDSAQAEERPGLQPEPQHPGARAAGMFQGEAGPRGTCWGAEVPVGEAVAQGIGVVCPAPGPAPEEGLGRGAHNVQPPREGGPAGNPCRGTWFPEGWTWPRARPGTSALEAFGGTSAYHMAPAFPVITPGLRAPRFSSVSGLMGKLFGKVPHQRSILLSKLCQDCFLAPSLVKCCPCTRVTWPESLRPCYPWAPEDPAPAPRRRPDPGLGRDGASHGHPHPSPAAQPAAQLLLAWLCSVSLFLHSVCFSPRGLALLRGRPCSSGVDSARGKPGHCAPTTQRTSQAPRGPGAGGPPARDSGAVRLSLGAWSQVSGSHRPSPRAVASPPHPCSPLPLSTAPPCSASSFLAVPGAFRLLLGFSSVEGT